MAGQIRFKGVVPLLLSAVAVLAGAAFVGMRDAGMAAVASRLDKIESQLAANEERLRSAGLIPRALDALDRRVSNLDTRVRYPRYARHYDGCPQCRGDVPNEEGGPPSLCEEGFEVWKSDMRAEKERRSPALEKPDGTGDER